MQLSLRTVKTGQASRGQVLERIRRHGWDTTPGKLRLAQLLLVLGVLVAGGVGVYAAIVRVDTTRDIAEHLEPLNTNVTTLYQSLADADATVAAGFLSGGAEPNAVYPRYNQDIARAATNLAQAGSQAGGEVVTARRIADITAQLPVYAGLVEQAQAHNRQGQAVGMSYLRRASELMQSMILPAGAELQRRQAARLDDAYQQAQSVPVIALAASGVSLTGLVWAQIFLFRRTSRIFNIGLVAASAAVIAGLVWWTIAGVFSSDFLGSSLGHSRTVSDALGPAQIAALRARAVEGIELVTHRDTAESDFDAQMMLLARNNGTGGALGAARQFATDQEGKERVQKAVDAAIEYATAHQQIHRLDTEGEYTMAVYSAVNTDQSNSAATTFTRLSEALDDAVRYEKAGFRNDIDHAGSWLTGLPIGTAMLALTSAIGVVLGVRQRLEEYP